MRRVGAQDQAPDLFRMAKDDTLRGAPRKLKPAGGLGHSQAGGGKSVSAKETACVAAQRWARAVPVAGSSSGWL